MTDLMYLSSTTSICHTGETDVKTAANKMYFSLSTAIHRIQHLVIKTASELHLGMKKAVGFTVDLFAVHSYSCTLLAQKSKVLRRAKWPKGQSGHASERIISSFFYDILLLFKSR